MLDAEKINQRYQKGHAWANALGHGMIEIFHYLALFVIGSSIVWSVVT